MLAISFDITEEIHDRIRGRKGSYKRAFEGIQKAAGIIGHPLLLINTSIQADNYANLDKLVGKAVEAGVDGMNVQVLWTRPHERAIIHNNKFPEYQVRDGGLTKLCSGSTLKLLIACKKIRNSSFPVNVFPAFSTQQINTWNTDPAKLVKNRRPKCPWMMAKIFQDGTMRMCDDIFIGDLKTEEF